MVTLIYFIRCLNDSRLTLKQMEKVDFVGIDTRFIKESVDKKMMLMEVWLRYTV